MEISGKFYRYLSQPGVIRIFLVFFYLLPAFSGNGQVERLTEKKWAMGGRDELYKLIPIGEKELIVYRGYVKDATATTKNWEIFLLNGELETVWNSVVETDLFMDVSFHASSGDFFYLLLEGSANLKRQVNIFRMNIRDRTFSTFRLQSFVPSLILHFGIFGHSVLLAGKEKMKPSVVLYQLGDVRPVILQGIYDNKNEIQNINIDNDNELVTVVLLNKNPNGNRHLNLRSYDEKGHPVENIIIPSSDTLDFINGVSTIVDHSYRLIASAFRSNRSVYPNGLFIGTVGVDGKLRMKFYKLSEIKVMKDSINQDVIAGILPDMYWHTSGIMDTPWGPAVLLEGAEINSSYAGQPIGVQQQKFIYREGWILGTGQEAGISWVNSINMTGLSSNIPQSWLQSMPSGEDPIKIWFYNSHGLGMKEIDKSRSVTGRYYVSLTAPETGDRIHFKEDGNGFLSCGSNEYFYYGVMTDVNESREEEDWFYISRVRIR